MPPRRRKVVVREERELPPVPLQRQRARSFKFFLYVFPTALVTIFFYFFALDSRSPGLLIGSLICASGLLLSLRAHEEFPFNRRKNTRLRAWANIQMHVREGLGAAQVAISSNPAQPKFPTSPISRVPKELAPKESAADGDTPSSEPVVAPETSSYDPRIEFFGVLAGFPVALQHHVLGTRALPQPPLCDLLPMDYLISLKRTESRVRFAEEHSGPSGSGKFPTLSVKTNGNAIDGPHSEEESDGKEDKEVKEDKEGKEEVPVAPVKKSNLHAPYPAHMPLSLLRLLEAYVGGFARLPREQGGWTPLQTQRAIDAIRGLNQALTEAESIYNTPDPVVSLTLCAYLFVLSILCLVALYMPPLVSIAAFGLMAAAFPPLFSRATTGPNPLSSAHPLTHETRKMLNESLDNCPTLATYYRNRVASRAGKDAPEVVELDKHARRREIWLPSV